MASKMEFVVKMSCESCVKKVEDNLKEKDGIENFEIDLTRNIVIVDTTLPSSEVFKMISATGMKTAFRGYGESISAVSILESKDEKVKGVVRFVKGFNRTSILDGTVDGLGSDKYIIDVHECGDISGGGENLGKCYNVSPLGYINANFKGRGVFKIQLPEEHLLIKDVIGRSCVVKDSKDGVVAYGIIARSAAVAQNVKTICACDGKNIWNEDVNSSL